MNTCTCDLETMFYVVDETMWPNGTYLVLDAEMEVVCKTSQLAYAELIAAALNKCASNYTCCLEHGTFK